MSGFGRKNKTKKALIFLLLDAPSPIFKEIYLFNKKYQQCFNVLKGKSYKWLHLEITSHIKANLILLTQTKHGCIGFTSVESYRALWC